MIDALLEQGNARDVVAAEAPVQTLTRRCFAHRGDLAAPALHCHDQNGFDGLACGGFFRCAVDVGQLVECHHSLGR
jgi:hypothetical protein